MKVDTNYILNQPQEIRRSQSTGKSGSGGFADLLSQAVENGGVQEAQSTSVPLPSSLGTPRATPAGLYQVDGVLSALDDYASALGNPNNTLRQVEPLVRRLENQAQTLAKEIPSMNDNELAGMAQAVLTQAQVEVIKYRRGDYV